MMFTSKRRAAAAFGAAAAVLLLSARVQAQPSNRSLSERGYERIRALSDDLDSAAQHSRSSFYGSDRDFQRAITTSPGALTHSMRGWRTIEPGRGRWMTSLLLADAKSVDARIQQSRRRDAPVLDDWSRMVDLLNQMIDVYQEDLGRGGYRDRRSYDRDPGSGDRDPRSGGPDRTDRYERGGPTEGPAYRDDRGYAGGRSSVAGLVSDVSDRANRLAGRARQLAGAFPADQRQRNGWQAIQKLAQASSGLGVRIDREGQPRDLRAAVAQLNAEGAKADRQMKQGNVFPELKNQWADLMQSLQRLREAAGA